ncbi:MAG TPA: hypothetical protein VI792_10205, partial [Candidatus Eisenbacteria bacterium]
MSVAPGASVRAGSAPAAPVEGAQVPYRAALVVAALCVVISITYTNGDADVWQHLLVGKAIWSAHAVPRTNLWTWPTWGEPQVLPSWGFRALLWPFWAVGGVAGLIAWRWLTTLAAFALALATARRMGARGVITLVVLVVCALVYRRRTQIRPETLVGILLALEIWILETRRAGGRDASPWLIGVAWVWANVHLSYPLGLAVLGFHALDDRWPRAGDPRGGPRLRLTGIGLAAVA